MPGRAAALLGLLAIYSLVAHGISDAKADLDPGAGAHGASLNRGDVPESMQVQHEKLRVLLESVQAIETTFESSEKKLDDTYGNVDVTNLDEGLDLSTVNGIQTARQRLLALNAKTHGFIAAKETEWAAYRKLVEDSDLAEPAASGLKASLAADENEAIPNYRAWFNAIRGEIAAYTDFANMAARQHGTLKMLNDQLVTSDDRTASELLAARKALADARHRYDVTGRAALDSDHHIASFVMSALRQLEEQTPHRGGT